MVNGLESLNKYFRKGSRWIYRIKEKKEFRLSYHSFVDVQAVRKLKKGLRYITNYS